MKKILRFAYRTTKKSMLRLGLTGGPHEPFVDKSKTLKALKMFAIDYLKSDVVNINNYNLFLDPGDTLQISLNNFYEPYETEFLSQKIKPGFKILDIGANIGYYTLLFSRLVKNIGHVYAFEPDPLNCQILHKNISKNNIKNTTVIEKAVFNHSTTIPLYISEDYCGDHKIYPTKESRSIKMVPTVIVDKFLQQQNIDNIDFIKMDIQGAEYHALVGLQDTLKKNRNLQMAIEYCPFAFSEQNIDPAAILTILTDNNFSFYNISEMYKKVSPISAREILQQFTIQKRNYANLYVVKK